MELVTGLDIGATGVRAIALRAIPNAPVMIEGLAEGTVPFNLLSNLVQTDLDKYSQAISELIFSNKLPTKVNVAIPESQLFSVVIELPAMKEDDIKKALEYEVPQYIPIPMTEVSMDFQIVPSKNPDRLEVYVVATPKDLVTKYLTVLEKAGLEVLSIDSQMNAAIRVLLGSNPPIDQIVMLVNLGATETDISIAMGKTPYFTRSIPLGGMALTRALATGLSMDETQAEQYKKTYGLDASQLDGKLVAILDPVMSAIVEEISRAISYFRSKYPTSGMKYISLYGGGAMIPGLLSYLTTKIQAEIQLATPLVSLAIDPNSKNYQIMQQRAPQMVIASGLSLRGDLE